MTVDWNFRVGDLAVVATLLLYVFRAGSFAESIKAMQAKIAELDTAIKAIAGAMTTMAVQKVEIERIQDDVKEMKHGRGFIQGRAERGSVDREY